MSAEQNKAGEPSFEEAMRRLDEIVAEMEDNQTGIEEMIRGYEEGVRLLRVCRQRIDTARQRVELITADLENGKAALTPFDPAKVAEPPAQTHDDSDSKSKPRRGSKTDARTDDIRLF